MNGNPFALLVDPPALPQLPAAHGRRVHRIEVEADQVPFGIEASRGALPLARGAWAPRGSRQHIEQRREKVLGLIRSHPGIEARELARLAGISRKRIYRDVWFLREEGHRIEVTGRGGYRLLEGGS